MSAQSHARCFWGFSPQPQPCLLQERPERTARPWHHYPHDRFVAGVVLHCPGFSRTMMRHESSLEPVQSTASPCRNNVLCAHGIVDVLEHTSCRAAHGFMEVASFGKRHPLMIGSAWTSAWSLPVFLHAHCLIRANVVLSSRIEAPMRAVFADASETGITSSGLVPPLSSPNVNINFISSRSPPSI